MFAPGPFGMLFVFILFFIAYLLISALFLRLASRWVLKAWLHWGHVIKVVLINLLVLLAVNFTLGLLFALSGAMPMMTHDDPLFNLISFLVSMAASAYVYGHWITPPDQDEPVGFGQGLLIYFAQLIIILATALVIGLLFGLIAALTA